MDRNSLRHEALDILRQLTGNPEAVFHDGQYEAIAALVAERRRALVVQRTGWGKSAVYFIAALLQRRRGYGPALIISPLLALMRDQLSAAHRAGVHALTINSSNAAEWNDIADQLDADAVDALLISPERLVNPSFRERHAPRLIERCGLLVIDEAHCVSDWGHDFRPDYRRLRDLVAELGTGIPILATTATANARVVADIKEQLGGRPGHSPIKHVPTDHFPTEHSPTDHASPGHIPTDHCLADYSSAGQGAIDPSPSQNRASGAVLTLRGPLARTSLQLGVLALPTDRDRLAYLSAHLDAFPGSGIIYTLTVSAAEDVARLLDAPHRPVRAYTGRTDADERLHLEHALRTNQVKALVATSALGMGFDKPDLGFVIHLGAPSSPVAYYQQVGRAGRGVSNACVLLLPGAEDRRIWEYFASATMPSQQAADQVLDALNRAASPLSTIVLESRINLRRSSLELLLKVLAVDGAVRSVHGGWIATGQSWTYDAERYARIAASRHAEQNAMIEYENGVICRMEFLTRQLDDIAPATCGRCDVCAGPWYPLPGQELIDASAKVEAITSAVGIPIEPRKLWPKGLDQLAKFRSSHSQGTGAPTAQQGNASGSTSRGSSWAAPTGRISTAERPETGRALARRSDLGWAARLSQVFRRDDNGHPVDAPIPNDLGRGVVRTLADWDWEVRPVAVVAMPSLSRPQLIDSLARGIAQTGNLPYLGALDFAPTAKQPHGAVNSVFRIAELWGRWVIGPDLRDRLHQLGGQPILLVDDIVNTRWSINLAARELRRAGSGPVLPFALAIEG
ncbi:RecQ family ATP-dependent DNA helicase [Devriesea agamarum]|uniref:RecQ family ATP-dependent DNA helicase n=1 Tax=Devriesea agamarum TaxID=472569 RepID=UPI0008315B02